MQCCDCDLVQQNMASKNDSDGIEWDVKVEIIFLNALSGLKPVGVNRFFAMLEIHNRFTKYISIELSSKVLWDHLDSMYGMAALHESEIIPFPNDEVSFELPPDEFNDLVKEKFGVSLSHSADNNETLTNSSSLKEVKKLNVNKLGQSTVPVTNAKSPFVTPVSIKPINNTTGNKGDLMPSSIEATDKVKQESPFPVKLKRAASPLTGKSVKTESPVTVKEEPSKVTVTKKSIKVENISTSASKKTPKSELNIGNNTKKSIKQETNQSSAKVKNETPDNSSKKVKPVKDLKKGRVSTPVESPAPKKSSKSDNKKTESDNSHRKSSDTPSNKSKGDKSSSKGPKLDDMDSSTPAGSKKQSVGKIDASDKKRKRQKMEDSAKKTAPPAKRRRT